MRCLGSWAPERRSESASERERVRETGWVREEAAGVVGAAAERGMMRRRPEFSQTCERAGGQYEGGRVGGLAEGRHTRWSEISGFSHLGSAFAASMSKNSPSVS